MAHKTKSNPMDENNKVSAEELAQEQTALAEAKQDEIKAQIISEYGFDEVDDAERIEKLVAKEVEHKGKLSQAIGQKIKYRELATKPKETPKTETKIDPDKFDQTVNERVAMEFEKRDLDSLDLSDELKVEVSRIAKAKGISVIKAAKDPYITFSKEAYDKAQKVEEASNSRTHKTGSKKTYSYDNPPDVDMKTEEGRAEWDAWKADMVKQGR